MGEFKADQQTSIKDFVEPRTQAQGRPAKVHVVNTGLSPPWHRGAGEKAWVFVDEISIN